MAPRFKITDHALDRFAQRHFEFDRLGVEEARQVFLAELEYGIPFGGQIGTDELRLLPCGLVAAIAWYASVGVVKTILTKEIAVANMESQGAVLRPSPYVAKLLTPPSSTVPIPNQEDKLKAELRLLAEKHLKHGVGKTKRKAAVRDLGYDLAGRAGDIYRAIYRELREAQYAERRKEHREQEESSAARNGGLRVPLRPNELL